MNDATKNKFADILAAAQAKEQAKVKPLSNATGEKPAPKATTAPTPAAKPQPKPTPPAPIQAGKIYSLMGANGKTMQEIKKVNLPIGCKVYNISTDECIMAVIEPENANGRQKVVCLSQINPRFMYIDVKYMKPISEKFGIGHYYADDFTKVDEMIISKYVQLAKEKENIQQTPYFTQPAQPTKQEETAPDNTPELSNFTFDDLMNTPSQEETTTAKPAATLQPAVFQISSFKTQTPTVTAPPKQVETKKPVNPQLAGFKTVEINGFTFVEYSDKSFCLLGETRPHKQDMHKFDGKWNRFLKCGPGWIFANKKYYLVKSFIERL